MLGVQQVVLIAVAFVAGALQEIRLRFAPERFVIWIGVQGLALRLPQFPHVRRCLQPVLAVLAHQLLTLDALGVLGPRGLTSHWLLQS